MEIYLIVWSTLFILSILEVSGARINKGILKLMLILILILTGLRYYNGTDYATYVEIFDGLDKNNYKYLEPIFRKVVLLFKQIMPSQFLFLIFSGISLASLYFAISRYEFKYKLTALYIYVSIFWIAYDFNGIRQGIAMNIFLLFITLNKKRYKIIMAILGIGFHFSSLICYFIYLFRKKYVFKKIKNIYICFILSIIFSNFFIVCLSKYSSKLAYYNNIFKGNIGTISLLQRIILVTFIFMFTRKYIEKDKKLREIINIYYIGFILYGLFFEQAIFSTRINMFFRILEIFIIPQILENIFLKRNRIFIFICITILLGSIYLKQINPKDVSPYRLNPNIIKI